MSTFPGVPRRFDAHRTLRREWWAKTFALVKLVGLTALVAWGFAEGHWKHALFFALMQLPDAWVGWRGKRDTDDLATDGDFLEAARKGLEKRLDDHRTLALTHSVVAAVLVGIASLGPPAAIALWAFAAFLVVKSAVRAFIVAPSIARELREYGVEPDGWLGPVITTFFLIIAPFLVLYGVLYRAFRRLIGHPVPEEPDDEDEGGDGSGKKGGDDA